MIKTKVKHAIIGSAAAKYWYPDAREPKDIDVIIYKKDLNQFISDIKGTLVKTNGESAIIRVFDKNGKKTVYEFLFADDIPTLEFMLKARRGNNNWMKAMNYCITPKILYSIKKAHIHYPKLKFDKHIQDFIFLRKKLVEQSNMDYSDSLDSDRDVDNWHITTIHRKATEKRLGKIKTPRLYDKPVDEFFDQSKEYVVSYYIHDDIHKAMAHLAFPAYELMQKDKTKADCSKQLWSKMTLQQKQYCVLEEAYVIALERKILPQMFEDIENTYTELEAFKWGLMRICTNLCSGFFRWFSCVNYEEILKQYNPEYVTRFFKNIKTIENESNIINRLL